MRCIEESLVWDENFAEKVLERKTYAHMGWAMREDAIYKDADVLAVGSPADLNAWGMQALESGTEKVDVDGRLEPLTFYSVWDRPAGDLCKKPLLVKKSSQGRCGDKTGSPKNSRSK